MKTRLTHVRANVHDLSRAIEWYSRMLHCEVRNTWPPGEPNYADFVSQEGTVFSVMEADPVPLGGRCDFSVKNVDALWEQLKDSVEIVEALFDTAYGSRKFTIKDLDGNELGFVQG